MKAYVDIENSKTKHVITYELEVKNLDEFNNIIFDISNLKEEDLNILNMAIDPKLIFTDIELFYIDDDNIPYFGPDYLFKINNKELIGTYIRKNRTPK